MAARLFRFSAIKPARSQDNVMGRVIQRVWDGVRIMSWEMSLIWAKGVDGDKANASIDKFLSGVLVKIGMRKVESSTPMSRPICAKEEDCL